MSRKKRAYSSPSRRAQSEASKKRILAAAKILLAEKGFDQTTIAHIAAKAKISVPMVYLLFKSKVGILRALVPSVLYGPQYEALTKKAEEAVDPKNSLSVAASITRHMHDAKKSELGLILGTMALSPELKKLDLEWEQRRYERQAFIVQRLKKAGLLAPGLKSAQARDVLWTLTSRENYYRLVVVRRWSSSEYERWLRRALFQALVSQ